MLLQGSVWWWLKEGWEKGGVLIAGWCGSECDDVVLNNC